MLNLGVKEDKHTDSLMVLQKEVRTYVLDNHKHPSDITYLEKELKGTFPRLMNQIPTIENMEKEWGIDSHISGTDLTGTKKSIVGNLQ